MAGARGLQSIGSGQNAAPPSLSPDEAAILKACQVNLNETDPKKLDAAEKCVLKQNKELSKLLVARNKLAITASRLQLLDPNAQTLLKSTSATTNPSQRPSANTYCQPDSPDEEKYIRVRRTLLDPKEVADAFGRRLGRRFIVFQITVENNNKDFQYMIHDMSIDLSRLFNAALGTFDYSSSTSELSILRGVPEKGQDLDPRNLTLHVLQGTGAVAGAVSGLTPFVDLYGASVAAFNGPLIAAYTGIAPDHTANQLNRLSDSAYAANTVVGKQQSKVFAVFVPQSLFFTKSEQNTYWNEPLDILATFDLRKADACVDGAFITEVSGVLPSVTALSIAQTEMNKFGLPNQKIAGMISGTNFVAKNTSLTVESPNGITGTVTNVQSATALEVELDTTSPVAPQTPLNFTVHVSNLTATGSQPVTYVPQTPGLTSATLQAVSGATLTAGANAQIAVKGSNIIPGDTQLTGFATNPILITNSADGTNATVPVTLPSQHTATTTYTVTLTSKTSGKSSSPVTVK